MVEHLQVVELSLRRLVSAGTIGSRAQPVEDSLIPRPATVPGERLKEEVSKDIGLPSQTAKHVQRGMGPPSSSGSAHACDTLFLCGVKNGVSTVAGSSLQRAGEVRLRPSGGGEMPDRS